MFNKVYGVDFNIRPFSEKIENYEIHILIPNSQNLEFIKLLRYNIESLMIEQTMHQSCKFKIFGADHQLFGKW